MLWNTRVSAVVSVTFATLVFVATATGPTTVIKKSSPLCSQVGAHVTEWRMRYVCEPNGAVVSSAVSLAQNAEAVRTAKVTAGLSSIINNTNYTNSTQLSNQTFLEEIGTPLVNESLLTLPCAPEYYNRTYCACPLDRSGGTCNTQKETRCNVRWVNPNIKGCIQSNGRELSSEDRKNYDVEIDGIPPCVQFDMDSSKYVWTLNLSCSFADDQRRKCNGSTATADAILSSGSSSNSENNIFKLRQCVEDTAINHWYNNGRPGVNAWASRRNIGDSRMAVKFYSMVDPFTENLIFQSNSLTGEQINGPSSPIEVEITMETLKSMPKLVTGGRLYSEGMFMSSKSMNIDSESGDKLVEWDIDDPSIVVDVKGYAEPSRALKELSAGEIVLIILLSLAVIFLIFVSFKYYKKVKND